MRTAIALLALFLAACSTMQTDTAQIVKDAKSGSVVCGKFRGVWGSGEFVVVNMEQGVIRNGGVTVAQECGAISINNTQNPPAPAAAPK